MVEPRSTSPTPPLSPLKRNIAANFASSIWQVILGLALIPLYIQFMGIESYGLIGVFVTLQVLFGLFDAGLGTTLNREMARRSALPHQEQEMRNLVRTLETLYWGISIAVGGIVVFLSPILAHHWIHAGQLPPRTVEEALFIMGFIMMFLMPVGFYSGGLMGLQKQVLLNAVTIVMNTIRDVGALLILWLISPTIQAFFLWQSLVTAVHAFLLAFCLWRRLPRGETKAVFQKQLLHGIWRFSAGMSGIAILGTILTQMDKVVVSKILSLEMFGYYMLASTVAMSLVRLFTPVFLSIYPRLTQLVSLNDQEGITELYHKSSQLIAVLILPVAIVIAFFSYEVILLWTHNQATAEKTHLILSILICGTALNGLMHPPYALQLAHGWTQLSLFKNIIAVPFLVPLMLYAATRFGAAGAASMWLLLNVGMFFFEIPIMHRRLVRNEMWHWYWRDVSVPLAACVVVAGIGRIFTKEPMSYLLILQYLMIISVLTFGIAVIATPVARSRLIGRLLKIGPVS